MIPGRKRASSLHPRPGHKCPAAGLRPQGRRPGPPPCGASTRRDRSAPRRSRATGRLENGSAPRRGRRSPAGRLHEHPPDGGHIDCPSEAKSPLLLGFVLGRAGAVEAQQVAPGVDDRETCRRLRLSPRWEQAGDAPGGNGAEPGPQSRLERRVGVLRFGNRDRAAVGRRRFDAFDGRKVDRDVGQRVDGVRIRLLLMEGHREAERGVEGESLLEAGSGKHWIGSFAGHGPPSRTPPLLRTSLSRRKDLCATCAWCPGYPQAGVRVTRMVTCCR